MLKSPLFGLAEQQLFDLAWGAGSLRTAMRHKAETDPQLADISAELDRLAGAARRETPFSFYAGVDGGRRKFLARLGSEAADALDELLNLALDYERRETPSLQGFVAWMRTAQTEVKRDMEIGRDEVRVMTVHGAKGLEAPTVILADTTTRPAGPRDPRLLAAARMAPGTPDRLIWARGQTEDVAPMREARERARAAAQDEYRRLLYVAMTRAAERLIICGTEGQQKRPDGCWYDLVHGGLVSSAAEEPADDGDGTVWRYRKGEVAEAIPSKPVAVASAAAITVPDWLMAEAPRDAVPARPLAPSEADDETWRSAGASGNDRQRALARGRLAHRLLQYLPEVPPDGRAAAAQAHLARAVPDMPPDERGAIAEQVLRVLDEPRFAALFGPPRRGTDRGRVARPDGPPSRCRGRWTASRSPPTRF